MSNEFEAEYRSTASGDAPAVSVLYADGDEGALRALAEYIEREDEVVGVWGTTDPEQAIDAVRSRSWSCVVVGEALPTADRRRLVSESSCATVALVPASDGVAAGADAVIEASGGDRAERIVEEVRDLADPDAATESDEVLARALDRFEGDESPVTAVFVVDDGTLVWSSHPFETVFPFGDDLEPEAFDDALAALFGDVPGPNDRRIAVGAADVLVGLDAESDDARTRRYRHQRYQLPDAAGGYRVHVFEASASDADSRSDAPSLAFLAERSSDGLFLVDRDGAFAFCNELFASVLGYDDGELRGVHASEVLADGEEARARGRIGDLLESGESRGEIDLAFVGKDGDRVRASVAFTVVPDGSDSCDGLVCVAGTPAADATDSTASTSSESESDPGIAPDALVRDVVSAFSTATDGEDLQRAVCESLVALDAVTMAWIGKREGANDRIVPATIVGEPKQYLKDVVATTSVEDAQGGPVLTAIETGEPVVVDDMETDEMVDHWRDLALSYGIRALTMVPITYGKTVHGVLCAYGTRPGTFSPTLVDRFALLGDAVGFALTALQNKRLLERDVSIELEFESSGPDGYLVWLARACECTLESVGSVDLGTDVLHYLEVDGAAPDAVARAARERDEIAGSRVVRTEETDAGVVELRTSETLYTALSDAGARLSRAVTTPSGTTTVVEVPGDHEVRTAYEVVTRFSPGAELVAKSERRRSPERGDRPAIAGDALTDRQREVLRAAYLAGYYAWPRDTTAEELADSLGIASPTLHQHLRRAERNILGALFDE